jgi:bifunctional non-homologous end joining protein LigD
VLYPDAELTKFDVARYYESIADWILPYVVDRPLTLLRCPEGQAGKCFYQKHWKAMLPAAVGKIMIAEKSNRKPYVTVSDLPGLISLVQISVLEIHPWGATNDRLDRPDQMIFDLDPDPAVDWDEIRQAARDLRTILEKLDLASFVRTSGGKGLHVVVPLAGRNDWDEVEQFSRGIAFGLARHASSRFVANMRKDLRRGKIFVDYLRNQRGSTSVASYSTRNRPGAPVAAPLGWKELAKIDGPAAYTVATITKRLNRLRRDPWKTFFHSRQSLTKSMLTSAQSFAGSN